MQYSYLSIYTIYINIEYEMPKIPTLYIYVYIYIYRERERDMEYIDIDTDIQIETSLRHYIKIDRYGTETYCNK